MDNTTESKYELFKQEYDEEDDEDECRVCRGPAEEGRPLFSPCKCSGSIGLVHQDCLKSWLAVTRGTKCELCSVPFKFVPKYADNAPDRLPLVEVVVGVLHRAAANWLPFALRALIAIILWVCILPLTTAYLYFGWMRGAKAVVSRWKWELVTTDTVAGGVVAGAIIISFLSLMSLADFLRLHWQQPNRNEVNANLAVDEPRNVEIGEEEDEEFDADIFPYEAARPENTDINIDRPAEFQENHALRIHANQPNDIPLPQHNQMNMNERNLPQNNIVPPDQGNWHPPVDRVDQEGLPRRNQQAQNINEDDRFEPRFEPMDAVEDQEDGMDIHVALDELLGLRGPLTGLIRNLIYLLAFNLLYLGIFASFPRSVGAKVFSLVSNFELTVKFLNWLATIRYGRITLSGILTSLNAESSKRNPILQLPDLAAMTFGYLFFGFMIFALRSMLALFMYVRKMETNDEDNHANNPTVLDEREHFIPNNNFRFDRMENNIDARINNVELRADDNNKLRAFLDSAASIVKVGVVIFVKMCFLPLFLGLWLDFATLSLFNTSINDRINHAGGDLFGSLLIHWVFGITFMLLVTVSVLQLREVAHPDLLAKVIRPQEPQPDLLGNILHETGLTHMRRMILSLAIYVALLLVFVWIPAKVLTGAGLINFLPIFRPNFWHILLPELQFPIELLIFHLSMLALLEKNKNNIGQMQHRFILTLCDMMNITRFILPLTISKFELVGLHPVYTKRLTNSTMISNFDHQCKTDDERDKIQNENCILEQIQIDEFWKHLSSKKSPCDEFISSHMSESAATPAFEVGITKNNGQRVLSTQSCIRISSEKPHENNVIVPTSIGRYRFRLHYDHGRGCGGPSPRDYAPKIEIWKEVAGDPLYRPPDGWDDLGAGGAEVQGRWAWENETKSDIEEGVAKRIPFVESPNRMIMACKLCILIFLSWLATVLLLCFITNFPLFTGRHILRILKIPEKFVHDPAAFAIGFMIMNPILRWSWPVVSANDSTSISRTIYEWITSFKAPRSQRKNRVLFMTSLLWILVIPFMVGQLYHINFIEDRNWFESFKFNCNIRQVVEVWGLGFILFHGWAIMCYAGLFTKGFWLRFRRMFGANENIQNLREGFNDNRNLVGEDNTLDTIINEEEIPWQGKEGKVAQFYTVIAPILSKWEWEKVDHRILLTNALYPITRQLFVSILIPFLIVFFFIRFQLIYLDLRNEGVLQPCCGEQPKMYGFFNMVLFRFISFIVVIFQIGSVFKSPLERWFEAAHRAARDERYLAGEILLNYVR